jgi:hypothetical protein
MIVPTCEERLLETEERLLQLLQRVAEETRPCRACGEILYFVRHRSGHTAPYTAQGINHFINCPQATQFRRKAKGKA